MDRLVRYFFSNMVSRERNEKREVFVKESNFALKYPNVFLHHLLTEFPFIEVEVS
jgi:hypothetical protein